MSNRRLGAKQSGSWAADAVAPAGTGQGVAVETGEPGLLCGARAASGMAGLASTRARAAAGMAGLASSGGAEDKPSADARAALGGTESDSDAILGVFFFLFFFLGGCRCGVTVASKSLPLSCVTRLRVCRGIRGCLGAFRCS